MTPELIIRTFTDDQYILDKVFYSNYYRLKGLEKPEDAPVVVDIGAHCGYFAFSAMALGAKKVYAFEPFLDNYRILLKNVEQAEVGKIIPHQVGVYTQAANVKFFYPKIEQGKMLNFSNINIDVGDGKHHVAPCITLDEVLQEYVQEEFVDILKVSIGYAESNILASSNTIFKKVKNICGETELSDAALEEFKTMMEKKGFKDSFFAKAEDGKYIFLFSKDKCEKVFNIYFAAK